MTLEEKAEQKKYRLNRDAFISREMIENEAFRQLRGSTLLTLIRFLQKRPFERSHRRKIVYLDDPIAFTQAEAKYLGIGKTQHTENIRKLINFGFIDLDHQGGAYARDYSRYKMSERWRTYGTENFLAIAKRRSCKKGHDIQSHLQRKAKALSKVNASGGEIP